MCCTRSASWTPERPNWSIRAGKTVRSYTQQNGSLRYDVLNGQFVPGARWLNRLIADVKTSEQPLQKMESLKSEMRSNENVIEHFTQLVVLSAIILIRRSETSFRQYLSSGNSVFLGEDIGRELSRQLFSSRASTCVQGDHYGW